MHRMLTRLAMIAAFLFTGALLAEEPRTFELRDGRYWEPIKAPSTVPATDEQLDRVGQLLEAHNSSAAKKLALNWIKRNPKNQPLRDRAVYLLGLANYEEGNRLDSFYNFDEVLELYPDSKYFYPALQKQYEIAEDFLSGYKLAIFGLRIVPADDEAIEILFRIQERSPGSPLAEKSLKRTADYYYASAQYDLAVDAYQAFIERYRRSPEIASVKLKRAFALLAQFRGTKFDPTNIINARTALEEFQNEYPELARRENVSSVIARIDSALARKGVQSGDFYIRTHQPAAAAYNYRSVLVNYRSTSEAQTAKDKLDALPAPAKEGLLPPPPSTRPTPEAP